MNHRTVSMFTRVLALGAFAAIAAACAAPVGNETEKQDTTTEALPVRCGPDKTYVKCGYGGAFNSTSFEQGLKNLGCSGRRSYDSEESGDVDYQTLCPLGKRSFPCERCWPTMDGGRQCGTMTCTDDIISLLKRHVGDANLSAGLSSTSQCECGTTRAPAGYTYVDWDPTCTGSACLVTYW